MLVARLRKRRELDALVVKGTRRRRGASQELLAREPATLRGYREHIQCTQHRVIEYICTFCTQVWR